MSRVKYVIFQLLFFSDSIFTHEVQIGDVNHISQHLSDPSEVRDGVTVGGGGCNCYFL